MQLRKEEKLAASVENDDKGGEEEEEEQSLTSGKYRFNHYSTTEKDEGEKGKDSSTEMKVQCIFFPFTFNFSLK